MDDNTGDDNTADDNAGDDNTGNVLIGRRVGPYRILDVLGRGAVSVVYLALNSDDDRIALKMLTPFAASRPDLRVSIEREFDLLRRMEHPAVLRARRSGTIADVSYLELDMIAGPTAAERTRRGPLPLREALTLGRHVADALHHVHRRRAVHRDVKPSNVLLGPTGPVLFDFGLALDLDRPDAIEGRIYGSPGYLSPEQALAGPPIDGRADLYSLGVTLFQLVTGRPLFTGERMELLRSHVEETPPRPSSLVKMPHRLERALLRCLAKDPADRFPTGRDLMAELDLVLGELPKPGRWMRRLAGC